MVPLHGLCRASADCRGFGDTLGVAAALLVQSDKAVAEDLANVLAKPGKQTLTLKTVTPHIKATFVVNIDSKKLGEAVSASGGVVASGDGSK